MNESLDHLTTEQYNEKTRDIDLKPTIDILKLMNEEDNKVSLSVAKCIPQIALAVDAIVSSFNKGGRLLYFGAGTSGRLGILDASECPPTFRTDPKQVQGIIAGGYEAFHTSVEGAEDNESLGKSDVDALMVNTKDVVVGIAASGRTPYVIGAMKRAQQIGSIVIGISNNDHSAMSKHASIMIEANVGPEVILGSTRMKAGTAQKLILNMLTTTAMIRCGKVYDNLMVDMQSTNEKLEERAKRLIHIATGADYKTIEQAYVKSNQHVKTAIVMIIAKVDFEQAASLLNQANGFVRQAIALSKLKEG